MVPVFRWRSRRHSVRTRGVSSRDPGVDTATITAVCARLGVRIDRVSGSVMGSVGEPRGEGAGIGGGGLAWGLLFVCADRVVAARSRSDR